MKIARVLFFAFCLSLLQIFSPEDAFSQGVTQINSSNSKAAIKTFTEKDLLRELSLKENQIVNHEDRLNKQKQEISELKKLVQQLVAKSGNKKQVQNKKNTVSVSKDEATNNTSEQKSPSAEQVKQVGLERRPVPKEKPPQISAAPNEGGVLLAPGKMVVEPSIEYSRSSALRVAVEGFTIIPALSIGSFEISQVSRNTITNAVAVRLGLFKRFEVAARVPYVYREESTSARPIGTGSTATSLNNINGSGLGDIEVSGQYQINDGKDGWPFFVSSLRLKSITGKDPFSIPLSTVTGLPLELSTGSGFYTVQPGITAIYPTDPAVLYSSLGYVFNAPRNVGGTFGRIDPGDGVNYSLGLGFALNDRTSFSLTFSHDVIFETKQNGRVIPTSQVLHVGQLTTGLSHKISDRVSLNLSVGAGITDDAPDMRVRVKVPVKMDLW